MSPGHILSQLSSIEEILTEMNCLYLTSGRNGSYSGDAYLKKHKLRQQRHSSPANVGLSSTIFSDRNISPPWRVDLDIKVMTGAVITWCNLNPGLFSLHPAWCMFTNTAMMFLFRSDEMKRGSVQIRSKGKQRRSFSVIFSLTGLVLESLNPDREVVSV